jgi:hypothetical protein
MSHGPPSLLPETLTVPSHFARLLILAGLTAAVAGCDRPNEDSASRGETIAEGVLFSVEYRLEDGRTGGFTRLNMAAAVPGGNGSWNVDAHGRLTRDYLLITYPKKNDLGVRAIPVHRLVNVQFGDGGVQQVREGVSGSKGSG